MERQRRLNITIIIGMYALLDFLGSNRRISEKVAIKIETKKKDVSKRDIPGTSLSTPVGSRA